MPAFRTDRDLPPSWGEVEHVEIVRLGPGEGRRFERRGAKEKLFVGRGRCRVAAGGPAVEAEEGHVFDLDGRAGVFDVQEARGETVLVRVCGRWGTDTGPCGVFTLDDSPAPRNVGDPAPYDRTTDFDNHYHDCDEYWVLFEGRGLAVSEGVFYEVRAGDCVATRRGHHHDFPRVYETVRGVYVETTLEGLRRTGHLWNHTHGPAPGRDHVPGGVG